VNGSGLTDLMHLTIAASAVLREGPGQTTLPGIPGSVGAARRFVADAVAGCPRADDLVLAVSELATNAVTWSSSGNGGFFVVRVRTAPWWARIEVTDDGPAPGPAPPGNGWGLGIVRGCTDRR
jgi:anti-sigma regulatory factor (Ser/Thr protein kinase)